MAVTRQFPIIKSIKATHFFVMKEKKESGRILKFRMRTVDEYQSDTLCIMLSSPEFIKYKLEDMRAKVYFKCDFEHSYV